MTRVRQRISFANVMSVMAVFIALGGSAYAIGLKKNSVRSKQIKAGAVRTADLGNDAVTSEKVDDGSLLGDDFAAGQLPQGPQGPQGERGLAGSPDTPQQVLDKLKSVDGSGSGLVADSVAGVGASDLGTLGRSAEDQNCLDDDENGENCATVNMTLPRAGRVLLLGDGFALTSNIADGIPAGGDVATHVIGTCDLTVDGTAQGRPSSQEMFVNNATDGVSTSTVTDPLAAGAHTFAIRCTEEDGDIDWAQTRITAVMLGSG